MMITEFVELTGFEPMCDEYRDIENEYMGSHIDKKDFCKEWVKQGGAKRLIRLRARQIELLTDSNKNLQRLLSDTEKRLSDMREQCKKEVDENRRLKAEKETAESSKDNCMAELSELKHKYSTYVLKSDERIAKLESQLESAKELLKELL